MTEECLREVELKLWVTVVTPPPPLSLNSMNLKLPTLFLSLLLLSWFLSASLLTQTWSSNIWFKVTPAVSKAQSMLQTPTCIRFCWNLFCLYTCFPSVPSYMNPTCLCVFWHSQRSSHPRKYWGVKREDTSPLGPLFCHDFLLSLWEINGPCFSPPEEVFIRALLLSVSLGACCAETPCEDELHTS